MPIDIESPRPRSALLRGVQITEFKGHIINPDPIVLQETDLLLEEFLSPTKLKALTGVDDLNSVDHLEMIVDTSETSLGNFGIYLPKLKQLKLNGSHVPRIRDLGTSLAHLKVLWLSRSGLVDLDGIATLNNLRELYLAYNDITDISACSLLENLNCLDLEGNLIDDLKQVEFLNLCPKLANLTLYGNPICSRPSPDAKENDSEYSYRHEVIKILPSLHTLDDELTLSTEAKSPRKALKSDKHKPRHNEQCPFDDDWQLINKILDEGIGPSEEKLAINESMRPGSGSSTSCASRTATGVRPLSSMRPLSSYRLKTTTSRCTRPNSRHSLNSSSSSRMSSSPTPTPVAGTHSSSTPPYSANSNNLFHVDPIFDVQHSDASHLTVGPTFQGNPLKSLLARKKINSTTSQSNSFTIQTNSDLKFNNNSSNEKNENKAKRILEEATRAKEVNLENKVLKEELESWRKEHARKLEERRSYFEPQVLVIEDDPLQTNVELDDEDQGEQEIINRPKSAFKSSFDCDEAINVVESIHIDDTENHRKHKDKEHRKHKSSRSRSKSKSKDVSNNDHQSSADNNKFHQPIIVSNSSQLSSSNAPMAATTILRPLKPPVTSQSAANGLTSLRQLKTNLTPLPEIRMPK